MANQKAIPTVENKILSLLKTVCWGRAFKGIPDWFFMRKDFWAWCSYWSQIPRLTSLLFFSSWYHTELFFGICFIADISKKMK